MKFNFLKNERVKRRKKNSLEKFFNRSKRKIAKILVAGSIFGNAITAPVKSEEVPRESRSSIGLQDFKVDIQKKETLISEIDKLIEYHEKRNVGGWQMNHLWEVNFNNKFYFQFKQSYETNKGTLLESLLLFKERSIDLLNVIGYIDSKYLLNPEFVRELLSKFPKHLDGVVRYDLLYTGFALNFKNATKYAEILENDSSKRMSAFFKDIGYVLDLSFFLEFVEVDSNFEKAGKMEEFSRVLKFIKNVWVKLKETNLENKRSKDDTFLDFLNNSFHFYNSFSSSDENLNSKLFENIFSNLENILNSNPEKILNSYFNSIDFSIINKDKVTKNYVNNLANPLFPKFYLLFKDKFSNSIRLVNLFRTIGNIDSSFFTEANVETFSKVLSLLGNIHPEEVSMNFKSIMYEGVYEVLKDLNLDDRKLFLYNLTYCSGTFYNGQIDYKDNPKVQLFLKMYNKLQNKSKFLSFYSLFASSYLELDFLLFVEKKIDEEIEKTNENFAFTHSLSSFKLAYFKEVTGYFINDLQKNYNLFVEVYKKYNSKNKIVKEILNVDIYQYLKSPILKMNILHNENFTKRLEVMREYNAKSMYVALSAGGPDAFLSTFRLGYNANFQNNSDFDMSFVAKARVYCMQAYSLLKEKCSKDGLYEFLMNDEELIEEQFIEFFKTIMRFDLLDTFLKDLGSEENAKKLIEKKLFKKISISSDYLNVGNLFFLSELLNSKNKLISQISLNELHKNLEAKIDKFLKAEIYAILINYYTLNPTIEVPEKFRILVFKYGPTLSKNETLSGEKIFSEENGEKVNRQLFMFYDDRKNIDASTVSNQAHWDGHNSFLNFMRTTSGINNAVTWDKYGMITDVKVGNGWKFVDDKKDGDLIGNRKAYLVIEKKVGNRKIQKYIVRPDIKSRDAIKLGTELMKNNFQIINHRGHSYHLDNTLYLVNSHYDHIRENSSERNPQKREKLSSVAFFNAGSCGGEMVNAPLFKIDAQIQSLGTKGVGTMLINDPIVKNIDDMLLTDGVIDWKKLYSKVSPSLQYDVRFRDYVFPNQNEYRRVYNLTHTLLTEERID